MTDYNILPIRFAGKIQSYVVTINGATFVQGKNAVTIYGDGFKRTINNSWYSDIKTEEL